MARACTICSHGEAHVINVELVARTPYRDIARRFGVSKDALKRHSQEHIPKLLVKARDAVETAHGVDLMEEIRRCFERINLLFDACDRWLRDADDPDRYDIGPRAEELNVTYEEGVGERTVRRKATLAELLSAVEKAKLGHTVTMVEAKHADPRDLVLKTAARLQSQVELLAKLIGELDDTPQVNILIAPQVQQAIIDALTPHPEARGAVAAALASIEAAT